MLPRSSNGKHLLSATLDQSEEQGGARRMLPKSGAGKHLLSATVDLSEEQDSGSRRMLPTGKGSDRHLLEGESHSCFAASSCTVIVHFVVRNSSFRYSTTATA